MNYEHDELLIFPCNFPIKVMGKANVEFEMAALSIIRKHCHDLGEGAIEMRYSKSQRYLSMTVTIRATSQEQLDAIYQELSDNQHVMMAL